MAILAECPTCHRKRAVKHKTCVCGQNMDSAKRSRKVRYWISYYLPGGKQRRELCDHKNPYSIDLARAADGKRKTQKVENPSILERLPEEKMTFKELAEWYLGLKSIKKLATYQRVGQCLDAFNAVLGDRLVRTVSPLDLENYQGKREEQGRAAATIDMEITYVKSMVTKAFDNDMVSGRTLKAFRSVRRTLKRGDNVRDSLVSLEQYLSLLENASPHYWAVLVIAYNTGMRLGEIRLLKWSYIDKEDMMIRLPKDVVKERRDKRIPINHNVSSALDNLPKALHHDFVITYRGELIPGIRNYPKAKGLEVGQHLHCM